MIFRIDTERSLSLVVSARTIMRAAGSESKYAHLIAPMQAEASYINSLAEIGHQGKPVRPKTWLIRAITSLCAGIDPRHGSGPKRRSGRSRWSSPLGGRC